MRLLSFKKKPWPEDPYKGDKVAYRRSLHLATLQNPACLLLSLEDEDIRDNGMVYTSHMPFSMGIEWSFGFGYECHKYDGFWHRFSLGPFFICWYSVNE